MATSEIPQTMETTLHRMAPIMEPPQAGNIDGVGQGAVRDATGAVQVPESGVVPAVIPFAFLGTIGVRGSRPTKITTGNP